MHVNKLFQELIDAGQCYRYSSDQWQKVSRYTGHPYPSPIREFSYLGKNLGIAELIQPPLEPVRLTQAEINKLQWIAQWITRFLQGVDWFVAGLREDSQRKPDLIDEIMSGLEWQWAGHYPGYSMTMPFVRLDCIRTQDGFKIVDINSTRPAGVGDNYLLQQAFSDKGEMLPIGKCLVETVACCASEWLSNHSGNRLVKFILPDPCNDFESFEVLAKLIANHGRFEGATISTLEPHYDPTAATITVRGRIKEGIPGFERLCQGYPDTRCIISPLHKRYLGSKIWPYLVATDRWGIATQLVNKGLFAEKGQLDLLLNCFAATGVIYGEMVHFPKDTKPVASLDHRDWLAKPIDGSSGKGIIFGSQLRRKDEWLWELSRRSGPTLLEECLPVREKVIVANRKGNPVERELYTKYGVFILGGVLAGVEVMARSSPLVHGARDTYIGTCVLPT